MQSLEQRKHVEMLFKNQLFLLLLFRMHGELRWNSNELKLSALGEEGKSGTRVWCTFQSFESKHAQSGLNSVWSGHSSNLNLFIGLIANLELRLRSPNTVLRVSRFESVKTCQSALCNVFARRSCKQNESNYPSPFSDGVSRTALAYLGKSYLFQKKVIFPREISWKTLVSLSLTPAFLIMQHRWKWNHLPLKTLP